MPIHKKSLQLLLLVLSGFLAYRLFSIPEFALMNASTRFIAVGLLVGVPVAFLVVKAFKKRYSRDLENKEPS